MQTVSAERRSRSVAAAKIVVNRPANLKPLLESVRRLLKRTAKVAADVSHDGRTIDYGKIEDEIAELVAEVETAVHECTLKAAVMDAPRVVVQGNEYARVAEGVGTYRSMTGPCSFPRPLYRLLGERNGPTIDVVGLRIGAIGDGWLPRTAQAMAYYVQQGTSREAVEATKLLARLPYSRASFERVTHAVGEIWRQEHADIEDELIGEFKIPRGAASISVSLDRAAVPMEEPAPRPRGRPRKDAPKRNVVRVFRMAYCATVTIHDKEGKAMHTIRRGLMPGLDPQSLCNQIANDVLRLIEKRRKKLRLILLADGAPELWNLLEANFPVSVFGKATQLIDLWHLIEKLAPAAGLLTASKPAAEELLEQWRQLLRYRRDAAATIREQLHASGREDATVDGHRPVHDAITYLTNHADRMNYAGALWWGFPVGTGAVEATCKTLIGLRMKRCGARWHVPTGNHVLELRALALSDRWDGAMEKLFATQRTSVRTRAA